MTRLGTAVLVSAAAVAVLAAVDAGRQAQLGMADSATWFAAGATWVALTAAGLIGRWPERRRTALLILAWLLAGLAMDAGSDWPDSSLAVTVGLLAAALQPALFAHMTLSYPSGWVRDRAERAFLVLAYMVTLLWQLAPALFADFRCPGCEPHATSLLFTGHVLDLTAVGKVFSALIITLGLAFLMLIARRLRDSSPAARRTLLPLVLAGGFAAAEFIVLHAAFLTDWTRVLGALEWVDRLTLLVVPVALFAGLATIRRHRGPLGDLLVELRDARPDQIEPALARAVGDRSLKLALWLPDEQRYVDCNGAPITVHTEQAGRAVTVVGPGQEPVAAIVHDASLVEQRALLVAAGSAASLAFENARLTAKLRAQLAELRASRARIVSAGDAERKRLERDLHDGAQQRLLAAGLALQMLADDHGDAALLTEARSELQAGLRDLRELARGIHPAILTAQGLPAAVRSLADRAPVPISVAVADGRHPEPVESAAYFVVSEAFANIAKHAHARSAAVSIERADGHLIVTIRDDGRGGAQSDGGGGLRGLADRVGALNGRMIVESPPGEGTVVKAEIPCVC
jgi:signal transduction histidine kinase